MQRNYYVKHSKEVKIQIKMFEVRDRITYIPTIAIKLDGETNEAEEYMLHRAGFGRAATRADKNYVFFINADKNECQLDPFKWPNRTMREAHHYVGQNFDSLQSGDVIDVEFILGESTTKKESERFG